jgi:hypothetical protein
MAASSLILTLFPAVAPPLVASFASTKQAGMWHPLPLREGRIASANARSFFLIIPTLCRCGESIHNREATPRQASSNEALSD